MTLQFNPLCAVPEKVVLLTDSAAPIEAGGHRNSLLSNSQSSFTGSDIFEIEIRIHLHDLVHHSSPI